MVMRALKTYEIASGQMINIRKSAITFGSLVDEPLQQRIRSLTGIMESGGLGKYLGLPESLKGSKQVLFGYLKDKIMSNLSGWYAKKLSQGGKEVLLKSIAMTMPVYAMSCFMLTAELCKNLTSTMMDFWWSDEEFRKKIHWLGWEKLTMPKCLGGIGFKDLRCFNQALLAKQAWRILHDPLSLFSRVFKSRYFAQEEFLSVQMEKGASYGWKSIMFGRELLSQGLRRVIGNGEDTRVWIDNWVHDGRDRRAVSLNATMNIDLKVSDLIDRSTGTWMLERLRALFPVDEVRRILVTKPNLSIPDTFVWANTQHGHYTVKTGYDLLHSNKHQALYSVALTQPSLTPLYARCWKLATTSKIRFFWWKALRGALAVSNRLATRGINTNFGCWLCDNNEETVNHVLFECPLSRQIWAVAEVPRSEQGISGSIYDNMSFLFSVLGMEHIAEHVKASIPWLLWLIWKNRNQSIFEGRLFTAEEVVRKARQDSEQWFAAQVKHREHDNSGEETRNKWLPPEQGRYKCNIGFSWSKNKALAGASWILRDHTGSVLYHSRRSFSQVYSTFDAKFRSWEWALEGMRSLHISNVSFSASQKDVIQAFHNPVQWPALHTYLIPLLKYPQEQTGWDLILEPADSNIPATTLAKSVTSDLRLSSYVAVGEPQWLHHLLQQDLS